MKRAQKYQWLAMAVMALLLPLATTASATVEKVITVPWQGDVNKQHTVISPIAAPPTVPDSITFEWVTSGCYDAGSWTFYLNGTPLGTATADPSPGCTCSPALRSFVVNNAALIASGAWSTTGNNTLRAVMGSSNMLYSWIRAQVVTGGNTNTVCVDDYNGGSCTELNLCTAGYRNAPVDVSKSTTGDIASSPLKGVVKTSDTTPVYYKWIFGDGSESGVTILSGATKYNVEATHTYAAAIGTPFTAKLQVSNTDPFSVSKEDPYLVKVEADNQDARINIAIDNGLWWLYKQANVLGGYSGYPHTYDNSPTMTWIQTDYVYTLATPTAAAVHAFGVNGHKIKGDPDQDPYVEAVQQGMNYLIKGYNYYTTNPALQAYTIAVEHAPDNPDSNGNGYGVEVYDWGGSHIPYQTGQLMDAIIASGVAPSDLTGRDFTKQDNTTSGHNWTYGELLQDMADMHAWGQSDDNCSGGKCGSWWYGWNYSSGDNSASQWAAIGMLPAQQPPWNIAVPGWVKNYNANWLEYSKCIGYDGNSTHNAFGYNGPCGCAGDSCFQTTTSGMVQMNFAGQTTADAKWAPSQLYIADNWYRFLHGGSTWGASMTYGWYSFAKAMRLSLPTATTQIVKSAGSPFDWYHGDSTTPTCTDESNCRKGLAQRIIETQSTDGSWQNGNMTNPPLTSAWMIITLKPTLFESSPIACFSATPNPNYADKDTFFNPSCSSHSESGKGLANLTKFEWDWDNNGTYDAVTTSPATVTHQFACTTLPCHYPVKLRVTDDSNPARTATAVVTINITDPPHPPVPVADAGGPYIISLCTNDSLKLDGSASYSPDAGKHETGCTTCPGNAIKAWDWDLTEPLTFIPVNKSGAVSTLAYADYTSYFTTLPGSHNIGLRVTDNTSQAFPSSGQGDLNSSSFGKVDMSNGCICTIASAAKSGIVQLTWTGQTGSQTYDILRSTTGPNTGFTTIASNFATPYQAYQDKAVVNGTTYYYRVVVKSQNSCMSKWVSAKPTAIVR